MSSQEDFDALKGRIEELENKLAAAASGASSKSLTPEELQAFVKVRDALAADWGENCGINECFRPRLCWRPCTACTACRACIFECTCGPCMNGPLSQGGLERFGGLGG